MRMAESRIRRIIREELEGEINEQGFLSNLAAGAKGAVTGAVQGAVGGGLSGAVQGAVGGAQTGVAANQAVAQAATALRTAAAQGGAPKFMAKMDEASLISYLMDWGGQTPGAVGRALWAMLRLITIQRERYDAKPFAAAERAMAGVPAINAFGSAVVKASGVRPGDPRWPATFADALVSNKVV